MKLRLALLCALVACSSQQQPPYVSTADQIMVIIPRGATYYQALDSLESRGVIKTRDWFSLYARIRGLPSNLKSGVYMFDRDASWSGVVTTLKSGRGLEVRFTVTEGMMGFEVAERARSWLGVSRDSFFAAMRDTSLERELGILPTRAGVDGYMYPTTYVVPMRMRARDLVKLMTHEFIARWQSSRPKYGTGPTARTSPPSITTGSSAAWHCKPTPQSSTPTAGDCGGCGRSSSRSARPITRT